MELWFTERHTNGVNFSIKVDRQLFSGHSEFQRIDIFDSKEFGRFLALDGYMMLTEKDEFIYHEMIVHVPMAVHPNVKKVLVIGAGDGGVIRELCRYETIETIDMVEIDELVVEVSKKYISCPKRVGDDKYKIKRVIYSTYQAVSGAGKSALDDLENMDNSKPLKKFPYPIFDNCLPHIDSFLDNGYTKEEMKMINETRKILHHPDLRVTATTVRVPVSNSHSESINVEFEKDFEMDDLISTLKNFPNIIIVDNPENNEYPMPINSTGHDEVFVGRIRRDESVKSGVNLWVVADNIRKGAASNAVQILEKLISEKI